MTRFTPYKDVTRAKCSRCGKPAKYQWEGPCALTTKRGKPRYLAVCKGCDAGLNRVTLQYMLGPERADELMRGYE